MASLESFLGQHVEENLNLDYKDIRACENPEKLAETICAFANSEGGLLVLGVEESREKDEKGNDVKIRPGKITWGPKSLTKEAIESKLVIRIHPSISGMRIYPIRNQVGEVVFLVDVPQSSRPPHQAPDRKYYLRYNFQNQPMDHYQIGALFDRRLRPKLRPLIDVIAFRQADNEIDLRIGLANEGGATAKQPMFYCTLVPCGAVVEREGGFFFSVNKDQYNPTKFTVYAQSPIASIHPSMINFPGTVTVKFDRSVGLTIVVGAEDMPTAQFVSGTSRQFLSGSKHDFSKEPLRLMALSSEDMDARRFDDYLRQLGEDPDRFWQSLVTAFAAAEAVRTPTESDEQPHVSD